MDKEKDIEPYYQNRAKYIVDAMFDKGYFVDTVTREDMQATEDLIAYILTSEVRSAIKAHELLRKVRERKDSA